MNNNFETICESVNTTLKLTKIFRYPRQIQFSEEFTKALTKEVSRHMQILDESNQPIKDLPEKFLKALKFELIELTESKTKKKSQMDLRPRQKWDINPRTRVSPGKKDGYNRAKEKKAWKAES
ncbi:MAG: hypothetical protein PHS54_00275 [Clostridia bacterium]|nr:hypothetical protein [Clostridia bacterium]